MFIDCQLKQIARGGFPVLLRKLTRVLILLLYLPFAVTALLIIRLLSPFLVIRLGKLCSDRIGHFAPVPEIYLCERETGLYTGKSQDIFYLRGQVSNRQLAKMWGRVLNITPLCGLALLVVALNRLFPGRDRHLLFLERGIDTSDFYATLPGHLRFTRGEEKTGNAWLRKMGIGDNAPFVCFHARDSAYLNKLYPATGGRSYHDHAHDGCGIKDWSYHNHRDCNAENYLAAAEKLSARGYAVLRMGAAVERPLVTAGPQIIDYAVRHRTDFLDIFLSAKCRFFIGSASGIDEVPRLFRRKICCVNCIPLEFIFIWNPMSLFIPKKLFLKNEKRFLSFGEIVNSGIGRFDCRHYYDERGIEVVENTPEEIADLAIEMDERMSGAWKGAEEDEGLQQRFWSILRPSRLYRKVSARAGARFLRQNQRLLE